MIGLWKGVRCYGVGSYGTGEAGRLVRQERDTSFWLHSEIFVESSNILTLMDVPAHARDVDDGLPAENDWKRISAE